MDTVSLHSVAAQHLLKAREQGTSYAELFGTGNGRMRQKLIALRAGSELSEAGNPGEATVWVLQGRVQITTPDDIGEAASGDLTVIPKRKHTLIALEDTAVVVTLNTIFDNDTPA